MIKEKMRLLVRLFPGPAKNVTSKEMKFGPSKEEVFTRFNLHQPELFLGN
jgi:hypothetical protein